MNCNEAEPLLPRLAWNEPSPAPELVAHLESCRDCAAKLASLAAARSALAAATVPLLPPLDPASLRQRVAPRLPEREQSRPTPLQSRPLLRRSIAWRAAAAAALIVGLAAFVFTRADLVLEPGGATLHLRWNGGAANGLRAVGELEGELAISPLPPIPPGAFVDAAFVDAIEELDQRLRTLEQRHREDLLLLAKSVDRQQQRRDQGLDTRLAAFEFVTRREIARTQDALGSVAELIHPIRDEAAPPKEH